MREIKLVNNEGEEFDLTRPDACLLDISGIGMEIEFETVRIGQCDVVVDEQPQYNPVSGMIPFMDMEPYTEFLQFIAKRPITLAYKPKNAWYFTSVRVSVVEKEEITPVDEYAETDVDFTAWGRGILHYALNHTEETRKGPKDTIIHIRTAMLTAQRPEY